MIFDLLFLLMVFASVILLAAVFVALAARHARAAGWLLAFGGAGWLLYLSVLVVVSLVTPQRAVAMDQDRCFDDWCVAVEKATTTDALGRGASTVRADGIFHVVTLRLSNHARGRPQRAASAAVHLVDSRGRRYDVSLRGQAAFIAQQGATAPLTATLGVGQSLEVVQVFDLPLDASELGLTIEHPVGFSPGWLIIGDEVSLLHKPTIVRLP